MEVSFSVGLQDPFSYSLIWFLLAIALMIFGGVVFSLFWWQFQLRRAKRESAPRVVKPPAVVLPFIKRKYNRQMTRLYQARGAGEVDDRVAYQELSRITRAFAYEATGIDVQNYTEQEIALLNIPQLTTLVRSFAEPEFSEAGRGDVNQALSRTAQTLQAWR